MRVTTRFFGILRQKAGADGATLVLDDGATVQHASQVLANMFPSISQNITAVLFAVNLSYVKRDHPLQDGDELAVIPPVSGGAR